MAATLYGSAPACGSLQVPTWHSASEWESNAPVCYGDWREFTAPANLNPALKRRSESKYSPDMTEASARVSVGQTTGFTGWVLPKLGAAGTEVRNWHCVAQLIGPNYDGNFEGGAPVSLVVRDGRWRLEQGLLQWWHDLGPYVDGKSVYVDLNVVASEVEGQGRITGSVGGVAIDVNHKTFWHQYLVWSHGLYRGSGNVASADGGLQPKYAQTVFWKLLSMTRSWPLPA